MMNKYLISVDIEGITGVVDHSFSSSKGEHYQLGIKYMQSDVNAVVQGIINADPTAEILVRDAHSRATNLNVIELPQRARLLQGWGNEVNMVAGLDETFAGVFLVGYHAGGHDNDAVLAHTFSRQISFLRVNDKVLNEAVAVAYYATAFKVPVAFISGDDHVLAETKLLIDGMVGVAVKQSLARDAVLSLSLTEAKQRLERGAEQATQNLLLNKVNPCKVELPMNCELGFYNTGLVISTFQKLYNILKFDQNYSFDVGRYVIKYKTNSILEFFQRLNLLMYLSYGINY